MKKPSPRERRVAAVHNSIIGVHDARRVAALLEVMRPVQVGAKAADNIVAAALMVAAGVGKLSPADRDDVLAAFRLIVINVQANTITPTAAVN